MIVLVAGVSLAGYMALRLVGALRRPCSACWGGVEHGHHGVLCASRP
jgi:hypothetical protein